MRDNFADFRRNDLTLLLMANGGLTFDDPAARLAASTKLAGYLLRAFRAEASDSLGDHTATSRRTLIRHPVGPRRRSE